jgi:hypothetical protein
VGSGVGQRPPTGAVAGGPATLTLARCAFPLAALAIGLLSLTTARESAVGEYGLIQALLPLYFVSLGILAISFILAWRTRTRIPTPRRRAASSR